MKEKKSEQDTKGNRHTDTDTQTHRERKKRDLVSLPLSLKFTPSRYSTTLYDEYYVRYKSQTLFFFSIEKKIRSPR